VAPKRRLKIREVFQQN